MEVNPHWRHKCDAEKRRFLASREDAALEFEHIGSTSVSGLGSTSIIDTGVMTDRTEGGTCPGDG
ncbi:MAG: GrpB family protein [Gemmatimonadota bacterium]|nr:GrpB family protein [Gemmatimonadota bacterium]